MKKIIINAIAATALLMTTNAFAWGGYFPGNACESVYNYSARINSSYIYANSSTGAARVTCPVEFNRDYQGELFGVVNVRDGSSTESVSCTFYSRDRYGSVIDSMTKSTDTSFTGDTAMAFYSSGVGGVYDGLDTNGAYSISYYCYLPGASSSSRIYSYSTFID